MQGQSHKGKLHVTLNFIILLQIPHIQSVTNYFKGNMTISLEKKKLSSSSIFFVVATSF